MQYGMKLDIKESAFYKFCIIIVAKVFSYITQGETDTTENSLKYLNFPNFFLHFQSVSFTKTCATILHATYHNTKWAHLIFLFVRNEWHLSKVIILPPTLSPIIYIVDLFEWLWPYTFTHSSSSWCSFTTTKVACSVAHFYLSLFLFSSILSFLCPCHDPRTWIMH